MIIRFNQDPRTCQYAECGRRFKPTHPAQLYCHPNCKYKVQLASLRTQYAEERGDLPARTCAYRDCDVIFIPERSNKKYHKDQCRQRESFARQNDRRRAQTALKKRQQPIEIEGPAPANGEQCALRYNAEKRRMERYTVPTELLPAGGSNHSANARKYNGGDQLGWTDVAQLMLEHADAHPA